MRRPFGLILRGVSATAIIVGTSAAMAQQSLPTIDVGAARKIASKNRGKEVAHKTQGTAGGTSRRAAGAGTSTASGEGSGGGGGGTGSGAGGYGGAGAGQDPYNKSYKLDNSSVGTRTDTPIMQTPLNVQTVPQQVLQDQQITSLDQAVKNISSVNIVGQAGFNGVPWAGITIRGFTATDVYRDGFRVDSGAGPFLQFSNVQSVEVLKGSGAMVYGFAEPGGIVNITTRQPLDAPYYSAQTQFGSFSNYRVNLDATGPLNVDKSLLYRMDMSYQYNGAPWGGPVDFVHDSPMFLAPVLKWNIDESNWVKLEADYLYDRGDIYYPYGLLMNGNWVTTPRTLNYAESSPSVSKYLYTALSWAHQFDKDWELKQQIAYYRLDNDNIQRGGYIINDNGSGPSISNPTVLRQIAPHSYSQDTYSSNAYLTGHIETFGAEHTLLLGGDFYKQNNLSQEFSQAAPVSQISVMDPIHYGTSFVPGGPPLPSSQTTAPVDTGGLYAQDQIKLPYDVFFMTGARYQYIRQNGGVDGFPSFNSPGATTVLTADTETALTPRFGLLWQPEKWLSFYAHYAEGFSANTGFIYPDTHVPPTSSADTEAGVKIESFDGKLRATLVYYDLTKTNYAIPDPNPAHQCPPSFGALSCSLVAGAVRSKGLELDVGGEILPGWNVIFAYSNTDARITKTNPGADQTGMLGQFIPGVPRNLGSFTTSYEFQKDSPLKGLKIGGGVDYHGAQTIAEGVPSVGQPQWPLLSPWAIVNLFAAYSFEYGGTKYTAQVNVNNLLDHTYYTDKYPVNATPFVLPGVPAGAPYGPYLSLSTRTYGAPMTILGSLKAEWPGAPSSPVPSSFLSPNSHPGRPYNWTGFYIGGQIGYGFGDNFGNVSFTTPGGDSGNYPLVGDASGVIGGAHLGYNREIDRWVMGVEASFDGANLSKYPLIPFAGPSYPLPGYNPNTYEPYGGVAGGSVAADLQGALRLRAGYAFGRLLPYAAAGVAVARFSTYSFLGGIDAPPGNNYFAADNRSWTRLGWTLGGGLEWAINDHWSARGEYRFSDFGQLTDTLLLPGTLFTTNRQLAQHQVQVGFSYRFVEDAFDAADFKALAPQNSVQSQPTPQPAGNLSLPGSAQVASSAPVKPAAAPAKLVAPPTDWTKYTWTGFYLGFQAGYAWGDNTLQLVGFDTSTGSPFNASASDTRAGWIGGAHLGYNYQIDRWVLGIEGSVDTTSFSRTTTVPVPFGGSVETAQTKSDVQATIRGRLGFAWDRALIYGAGGLAWERFDTLYGLYGNNSGNPNINGGGYYLGSNEIPNTRLGWTLGAGVEYALNDHWAVRAEYRYINFGSFSNPGIDGGAFEATPGLVGSFLDANRQVALSQVQLGFSYKIGAPAPEPGPLVVKGPPGAGAPHTASSAPAATPSAKASPTINWTGFSWTGVYVGAQIGYAFGDNHGAYNYMTPGGWVGSDPLVGDAKGIIVGGHLGYNRQVDNWVVGVEGSVDGANLVKSSTLGVGNPNNLSNFNINGTSPANAVASTEQSDIQGALRARAGYAVYDRLLTFASAGGAVGRFPYQSNIAGYDNVGFFAASNPGQTGVRVGWTIGGGVEWAVNRNWSVRGEYRYSDFGSFTDTPSQIFTPGAYYSGGRHLDQNQVQFGFDYKFGDWLAPTTVVAKF